ncbi:MAG: acyl-CoA dehydrogenase, partial [Gemmatimonadota bacterium]
MSTPHHYKSNLRDTFFNLFEVNGVGTQVLGHGRFEHLDEETARDALAAIEELSTREIAKAFEPSDRIPLALDDDGNVHLQPEVHEMLDKIYEGGWQYLEARDEWDGIGMPPSVGWAAFEMMAGAAPMAMFYTFGTFIARVIDALGTEEQRKRFVGPMLENGWGGTMQLSEPQAGSDVGEATTSARDLGDGTWALEGTKIWITNGDYDYPDNIVHLVLARPEGAGPGTKGLSLFIVPKFWVNEDGSLGERNGVVCGSIEKKMGIKGSATCVMNFGEAEPARGFLMGEKHDGIRQMFALIEQARMSIGFKSMSTLSTAYLNALEYAKERVQGPDLAKWADKTSPRVRIIEHPDVRRMLMLQKSYAEGLRALCYYTSHIQDQVELEGGHGAPDAKELDRLNDLLLPIVKGFTSEIVYEMLALSLQTLGGSGFVQDYPMEQYVRDQKIDSLYEGTTHIQALDLVFRKVARDGGETLGRLAALIEAQAALGNDGPGGEALAEPRKRLGKALGEARAMFAALLAKNAESVYHTGFQGNRVLYALGRLVVGWLLVRNAAVALERLAADGLTEEDRGFYRGKGAAARFYAREVLPEVALDRRVVEEGSLELMELDEEAF